MNDTHPYTVFSVAGEPPARGGRRLVAGVLLAGAMLTFGPHAVAAVVADDGAGRASLSQESGQGD
jgi:hypothetical protein